MTFEREERYIVVKLSHIDGNQTAKLRNLLANEQIGTIECVVVENDWPEYETVWQMIEDRCSGRSQHAASLRAFYADVHARNVKAGWWTNIDTGEPLKRSVGEMFMLFVTELAEAYEAYLTGDHDDKLPQYPGLGVELGDLEIRLADFCGGLAAGRVIAHDPDVSNPGASMFAEIVKIAKQYEAIRKTPAAKGDAEIGDFLEPQDVAVMVVDKMTFNATRADHQIANRLLADGKRT